MKRLVALVGFALLVFMCFDCSNLAAESAVVEGVVTDQGATALTEYLAKEDSSYRWVKIRDGKIGTTEYVELILTSQTWRDIVWKHRLFILRPSSAKGAKQGLLVIAGGNWNDKFEDPNRDRKIPDESKLFSMIAEGLQSPVAVLLHVPQQPMFDGLVEDGIISLTFDQYLTTGDPEWPLLLPMVKSAVRGMDAVQEYCRDQWSIDLESFTVTGASKRGWTTWLVGATDSRVNAIAPMVIDMLNMAPQMEHQREAWGKLSEKIDDYTDRDIPQRTNSPEGAALRRIVDPFSYREALTQPKLIIIGTNDRYWPLDALNLYWDQLQGQKHVLYVPNNRHGIKDFPRILGSLGALHEQARGGRQLPELSWSFDRESDELVLRIESDLAPRKVQVWMATSATRDFRDSKWSSSPAMQDAGAYTYAVPPPASGYAAVFGEAVYERSGPPFYLSTNVRILSSREANVGGAAAAE